MDVFQIVVKYAVCMHLLLHSRGRLGNTELIPIIEKYMSTAIPFIMSRNTLATSHGNLAFAGTSRDYCHGSVTS